MPDTERTSIRIQLLPEQDEEERYDGPVDEDGPWVVILYNDDRHPYDQVVAQVMRATECSEARADRITAEAHTRGRAIALTSSRDQCERAATILRSIRLQVETDAF